MLPDTDALSNAEFVEFCYKTVLKRLPANEEKSHFVNNLEQGYLTRKDLLVAFVTSEEFKAKTAVLEYYPPGHFHSAIPSLADRENFQFPQPVTPDLPGINLNIDKQLELLTQFKQFYDECPFPEYQQPEFRYYFTNPSYSYMDAITLYSMMRYLKPQRIIEVGAGFTSCVMLDTADHFLDYDPIFTFIEPYPDLLLSLIKPEDHKHTILAQPLQAIEPALFKTLEMNDILFIDSTHVSKLNSDVNYLLFDILPTLELGVLIHFHDIFWPFEYPEAWIREGKAWNEAYILRAFLEFNDSFEIVFFSSYLHTYYHDWFKENMPLSLKNSGGNIWIRKIK